MLGAIIGDIVGSRFEWHNIKTKEFDFLTYKCFPTDDSVMTLALEQTILVSKPDYSACRRWEETIPTAGMAASSAIGCSLTILSPITALETAQPCA